MPSGSSLNAAASVDRPVNVILGLQGVQPSLADRSQLGVKRISIGSALVPRRSHRIPSSRRGDAHAWHIHLRARHNEVRRFEQDVRVKRVFPLGIPNSFNNVHRVQSRAGGAGSNGLLPGNLGLCRRPLPRSMAMSLSHLSTTTALAPRSKTPSIFCTRSGPTKRRDSSPMEGP